MREVPAPAAGFVEAIDAEAIGLAAVALGAGRARVEDRIDPAVGILVSKKLGDRVERGEPLCAVHHGAGGEAPDRIAARIAGAYRLGPVAPAPRPLILETLA